jgi:glycosyltransferase EpsJ
MLDGVSVVVPVYNIENYLRRALESYVNQTLENKELIIIDDGSTDSSGAICDEYTSGYDFVSVYHITNAGLSNARNLGLENAKYKYIVFWDGDDYSELNTLEEAYLRICTDDSDMVVYGYYMEMDQIDKYYSFQCVVSDNKLLRSFEEFSLVELWDNALMYNAWNKLYSVRLLKEFNLSYKNLKLVEDVEFNTQYLEHCNSISVMNQCFYHYIRERKGSLTSAYVKNWFEIRNEEHDRLLKYFINHGIENEQMMEFLHRRYIERVLGCIENEFHNPMSRSLLSVYKYIKQVIRYEEVEKSLKIIRPKSKKIAVMIIPMKMRSSFLTFIMGVFVFGIRSLFPRLFVALKNAR